MGGHFSRAHFQSVSECGVSGLRRVRRESDEAEAGLAISLSRSVLSFLGKMGGEEFGSANASTSLQSSMDQISIAAASGLQSRIEALDMVANNLANSTTSGFKLDREFYSIFSAEDNGSAPQTNGSSLPLIQRQWTDFSQGQLQPTGSPLDVALNGKGFFVVNGPSGPLYTRNGSFTLSPAGVLTTSDGYPVTGTSGQTIQTQAGTPVEISTDGTIQQNGQTVAQFQVVDFRDPMVLSKMGGSYFANSNPAKQPVPVTDTTVEQGKVEGSNVAAAESAVRLVGLMRQFEMLQKAITMTSDMDKKALEEVARAGA
jgi:flagellar basal-body rod protein FlgF